MAIDTVAARLPASRLPSLPQKRGAAVDVDVDVDVVGAAGAAKPAPHDPRLLPQSRQKPAPQRHTMVTNTTAARSPASRLASLPQKRGAAAAVALALVGAAEAAKPAAHDPRLHPHSGKSTAAPHDGDRCGRCKVTSIATPVAPTKAGELPLPVSFCAVAVCGSGGSREARTAQPTASPALREKHRSAQRWRSIRPLEGHQLRDLRRSHKNGSGACGCCCRSGGSREARSARSTTSPALRKKHRSAQRWRQIRPLQGHRLRDSRRSHKNGSGSCGCCCRSGFSREPGPGTSSKS